MKYSKFLWLVRKDMDRRIRMYRDGGAVIYFMCNAAAHVAVQDTTSANYERLAKDIRALLGDRVSLVTWLTDAH